ncbi:MAG: LacI family DNA-binding transcriptional regulator [Rhodothermia bacterium]
MAKQANKPTIRDVAADCGLSIATVSAVVNNAGWVPAVTRSKVEHSIQVLGYRPNRLARGLKTSQSYTVGVIVSDVTNPFFTDIVRSLGHVLRENDRNLVLCESEHEFNLGDRNFRMLLEKQVDAIVLIGDSVSEDLLKEYRRNGDVPIVAIERDYDIDGISKLLVDSEKGAFEATRHLLDQGFERVGMISGPSTGPGSATYGRLKRCLGYERALGESGLPVLPELVVEGDFRIEGGRRAMEQLLDLDLRPDAVFAANDLMALGAMQAIRDRGLAVPGDIGLVGYDDIPMVEHASTPLTTLAMPRKELGGIAATLILEKIAGRGDNEPVRRIFSCEMKVRQSSKRLIPFLS